MCVWLGCSASAAVFSTVLTTPPLLFFKKKMMFKFWSEVEKMCFLVTVYPRFYSINIHTDKEGAGFFLSFDLLD